MNKKWFPLLLVIALGLLVFFVKNCGQDKQPESTSPTERKKNTTTSGKDRDRGFDRRVSYIEYTQHAKCRMGCRKISQSEVEDIMQQGKINYNKSNVSASPCPTYALEGISRDDQKLRIIFGQCDLKTKVITVIDLETEWSCDCPGDDDKYKNKN